MGVGLDRNKVQNVAHMSVDEGVVEVDIVDTVVVTLDYFSKTDQGDFSTQEYMNWSRCWVQVLKSYQ